MRNQKPSVNPHPLWWQPGARLPTADSQKIQHALRQVNQALYWVKFDDRWAVGRGGFIFSRLEKKLATEAYPLQAHLPPLHPQDFGEPFFKRRHDLRYPYIIGAMANGITTVEMVSQAGQAGFVGFFGSAGLLPSEVEAAIDRLQSVPEPIPFGFNLIHSPHEPESGSRDCRFIPAARCSLSQRFGLYGTHRCLDLIPAQRDSS